MLLCLLHFRTDSMGLHKVGNPTDEVSVTLHLYTPPYQSCKMWMNPGDAKDIQRGTITFNSVYGKLAE